MDSEEHIAKIKIRKLLKQMRNLSEIKLKEMSKWKIDDDFNQSIQNLITNLTSDSQEVKDDYEKQLVILNEFQQIFSDNSDFMSKELISILKFNKDKELRKQAAKVIGYIRIDEAEAILIGCLLGDPEPEVREKAAYALGELHSKKSIEALIHALEEDKSYWVRAEAAWALGMLKQKETVAILGKALKNDSDDWVRISVAAALGEFDVEEAIDLLEDTISKDYEPLVKKQAEKSIIEIFTRKKEKKE
ncbi:MAG TPA: HEAT repeat domain-containing protein [candidate division Zixibacteria bacterium]|nr:HEAT repeat domain-containing protein [candidate division Zixibacteria bacterium]HUU88042.1 HEAT repeat domain-containing protein [Candidatus Glassbacteria bacterium]